MNLRGNHRLLNFHKKYPIRFGTRVYPTAEHLFQALKATTKEDHEYVRQAKDAREAKARGREIKLRRDWEEIKFPLMVGIKIIQLTQHSELRDELVDSYPDWIYELRPDPVWGTGTDGKGKNLMGRALVIVRDIFRTGL